MSAYSKTAQQSKSAVQRQVFVGRFYNMLHLLFLAIVPLLPRDHLEGSRAYEVRVAHAASDVIGRSSRLPLL